MPDLPTLYVCELDDGGPGVHPCKRIQAALDAAGIEYEKEIADRNLPLGLGGRWRRSELKAKIGTHKLPTLVLPDGTVLAHSPKILRWVNQQSHS
jgi:glutathione S-transferase